MITTETVTQSHIEPIALPLVGRWYQHFRRGRYRVIGNATHGEKTPDCFSYQAVYAPTQELVSIVSVVGDVIHYQFTRYPEKNSRHSDALPRRGKCHALGETNAQFSRKDRF